VIAQYITSEQIEAFEAKGWTVVRLDAHHYRYYLAWREDD